MAPDYYKDLETECKAARKEDGDFTIWSDPPKWWLENGEPDLSWLEAYRERRDKK